MRYYQGLLVMKKQHIFLLIYFSILLVAAPTYSSVALTGDELIKTVSKLQVGLNEYVIGQRLTSEQINLSNTNAIIKSYVGTKKFKDGDLYIIVEIQSNIVLAVYKQFTNISPDKLTKLLNCLITNHGEPTAMAHEKIIYWAYGTRGKISEKILEKSRKDGNLEVLVSVKLNSNEEFRALTSGEKKESEVYVMISSEPILQEFVAQ